MTKICTKCGIRKGELQFYKNIRTRSGLRSECKECSKDQTRDYRRRQRNVREGIKTDANPFQGTSQTLIRLQLNKIKTMAEDILRKVNDALSYMKS